MGEFREVSESEFRRFVRSRQDLRVDVCGISEPPLVSYNDFSGGKVWPESMVAKTLDGSDRYWIRSDAMDIQELPNR